MKMSTNRWKKAKRQTVHDHRLHGGVILLFLNLSILLRVCLCISLTGLLQLRGARRGVHRTAQRHHSCHTDPLPAGTGEQLEHRAPPPRSLRVEILQCSSPLLCCRVVCCLCSMTTRFTCGSWWWGPPERWAESKERV